MKFNSVADYQKTILAKVGVRIRSTDTVLDLGCGRGDNAVIFSKKAKRVIAVDIEPWKEWTQTRRKNLSFKRADATKLPFESGTFDVVFTKDTLHHVKNVSKALSEIKRVTKKNGLVYIVEANRYNPIFYIHMTKMLGHEHFSRRVFKQILLRHFKNVIFKSVESRVYPVHNKFFHTLMHTLERLVEQTPFVNNYSTYNIAIATNK